MGAPDDAQPAVAGPAERRVVLRAILVRGGRLVGLGTHLLHARRRVARIDVDLDPAAESDWQPVLGAARRVLRRDDLHGRRRHLPPWARDPVLARRAVEERLLDDRVVSRPRHLRQPAQRRQLQQRERLHGGRTIRLLGQLPAPNRLQSPGTARRSRPRPCRSRPASISAHCRVCRARPPRGASPEGRSSSRAPLASSRSWWTRCAGPRGRRRRLRRRWDRRVPTSAESHAARRRRARRSASRRTARPVSCLPSTSSKATWTIQSTSSLHEFVGHGVSCSGSTCLAVGSDNLRGTPDAAEWNGKRWSSVKVSLPPGATEAVLSAVSCTSSSACEVVGNAEIDGTDQSFAAAWTGGGSLVNKSVPAASGSEASGLAGVSCVSKSWCVAVGFSDDGGSSVDLAEHWNGSSWSVVKAPNPSGGAEMQPNTVSCTSTSFCEAAGEYRDFADLQHPLALGWNGKLWKVQTAPEPSGAAHSTLLGVSCTGTTCMAVGDFNATSGAEEMLAVRLHSGAWSARRFAVRAGRRGAGACGDRLHLDHELLRGRPAGGLRRRRGVGDAGHLRGAVQLTRRAAGRRHFGHRSRVTGS